MKTPLEKAKEALAAKRASGESLVTKPDDKHNKNPKSLRLAINGMCWQCQGEDADPCVKWRIGNCEITGCCLWTVRPYKHMHGSETPANLL